MRHAYLSRILPLCLSLVLLLSVSGVYASWKYAEMSLGSANGNFSLEMDVFHWQGSEILPDEEETGNAHVSLIDRIINGEGIGLNSSGSYLNEQIRTRDRWGRDTLGSMAITQGTALETLFDLNTENVAFLIHMKSDTTYYIFTTSVDLGEREHPTHSIGSWITPIYRTEIVKQNGTWIAVETLEGQAKSAYYEESQLIFITRSKIPSFDPDTWSKNA